MGSKQKVVKGVVWTMIVNLVNAIYGFISVPILINYFGKAEYGLIGIAMSINVYMNLMDMGFNSTNVRFFSTWLAQNKHERLLKGFQTSLSFYGIIGLFNALVLLTIALFSNRIFNITQEQNEVLRHLFSILAISAFCQWFSSCFDQVIKATENVDWIQKRTLLTKILMLLVLGGTVLFGFSIEIYFILTCLAQLAIVPMSVGMIKKNLPFVSFAPKWDSQSFSEMLPYCLNIFSFSIFQFSFYNLRPVFLGIQGTVESVADYRILNAIIGAVSMFGGTFMNVLLPSAAKIVAQKNNEAYYRIAYNGTRYVTIVICFCCFGIMVVGPELLTLYVGKEYLYLIPWLNAWLLCTLGTHNQAISSLILSGSNIRAITYNSVVASCVGLILCWFLIPYFQIGGTVISFLVYLVIQLAFYYLYYWPRKMNINSCRVFFTSFLPYVLCGYFLYILSTFFPCMSSLYMDVMVKGGFFLVMYAISIWFLIDKTDKAFVLHLLRRKNER